MGKRSSSREDSYENLLWSKVTGRFAFGWDEKPYSMEVLLPGFLKAQTAEAFGDPARETNGIHAIWDTD